MADLFRHDETRQFIREWRQRGWPKKGPFSIQAVAAEQRANLEGILRTRVTQGTAPSWCDLDEYEECVLMLESEAARESEKIP